MSTKLCTYGQLKVIISDMQELQQHPAFEVLFEAKIKRFYEQNAIRINALKEGFKKIHNAHIQKDGKGEYKTKEVVTYTTDPKPKKKWYQKKLPVPPHPTGKTTEFVFIDDDHKSLYENDSKSFLSQTFQLFT